MPRYFRSKDGALSRYAFAHGWQSVWVTVWANRESTGPENRVKVIYETARGDEIWVHLCADVPTNDEIVKLFKERNPIIPLPPTEDTAHGTV